MKLTVKKQRSNAHILKLFITFNTKKCINYYQKLTEIIVYLQKTFDDVCYNNINETYYILAVVKTPKGNL